jgi:hypothetical protein
MKKLVFGFVPIIILIVIFCFLVPKYNYKKIIPTSHEIELIQNSLGEISIKSESDLIRIQNKVVSLIKHGLATNNPYQETSIDTILQNNRGMCWDRSMLLQKIMIYNDLEVIPVYLYYNKINPSTTSIFNFFDKNLQSHNVFEVKLNDKKILVRTNTKMEKIQTLNEYLNDSPMPIGTKYLRHLNNRNGYFIFPSWIPDIY